MRLIAPSGVICVDPLLGRLSFEEYTREFELGDDTGEPTPNDPIKLIISPAVPINKAAPAMAITK